MRTIAVFLTLLASVWAASAQEQERKLVDRLLKPDMSLTHSAQKKQFSAAGISIDKRAPFKSYYAPPKSRVKSFAGERAFTAGQFATHACPTGDSRANISARSHLPKNGRVSFASDVYDTGAAPESGATLATAAFAGHRPFPGRGKSQKALSAQDRPLTIEQVRELLNKNK